ncbi:MAG: BRO domain-containing protein [Azospirillum brasilense]|nr:MAG: BRO domain-containing protein [Azospirillum brasilense]
MAATPAIFTFPETQQTIRMVLLNGVPWFLSPDVRRILGIAQNGKWLASLSDDEIRALPRGLISGKGMAQVQAVSESGLYKVIMRSDKPQARAFQDWVTRDVLPAIRKDGMYVMGEEKVERGELHKDT